MPRQLDGLLELISEPYASMVFVAVYTGLASQRVDRLRGEACTRISITIEERCCRGDWDVLRAKPAMPRSR